MTDTLQSTLALLDEGLSLYRRNFVAFVLIAASWFVPVACAVGLVIAADTRLDSGVVLLLVLLGVLLLFPLLIYLVGGLSRAAVTAAAGRRVRFREALAIHPARAAGMGCFSIIYYIIAQVVSSTLSLICICPLYFFGFLVIGGLSDVTSSSGTITTLIMAIVGVIFVGVYIFVLIVGGATYSSLIYGIQPWVQEARPFGESMQRSFELIGHRFGRNLVVWGLAALLVASVGLTVTLAIGLLLPLPLTYALGTESSIAQAVSASAWLIGFIFVLPPLPIWMALLYQRNRAERDGAELDARVQAWWSANFAPPAGIPD
jgi:hypothetical protein